MKTLRRIFQTATTSQGEIRDLLQVVFANELMAPSKELFLVSPWISDIVIIDNRMGGFDALNPEWKGRQIRLTEVIIQLMSIGSEVSIITRPDPHNDTVLNRISTVSDESALAEKVYTKTVEDLHTKGILTEKGCLLGSMNITYNGIEINEEFVSYHIDKEGIAEAKLNFDLYRKGT